MKKKKQLIQCDPDKLKDRLKEQRAEKDGIKRTTQEIVGKAIGRSFKTIGKFERGEQIPSSVDILLLAQFYNCSVYYLLGVTDEKIPFEFGDIQ